MIALVLLGLAVWLILSEGREEDSARMPTPVDAFVSNASNEKSPARTDAIGTIASAERGEDASSTETEETVGEEQESAKTAEELPKDRQEECLQRALNLVPDENVMLLAGVLMDKSQPKELVELVFNDVLNRDEDVKQPILQQIFKDKTHPCWADTAWFFDVTGETPTNTKPGR